MAARSQAVHAIATVLALGALTAAGPAQAAFPGVNGRIAHGLSGIHTIDPSGLAGMEIPNPPAANIDDPAYSPDGTRLAFVWGGDIYTTDQYGADRRFVYDAPGTVLDLDWSPDGERMVAAISDCDPTPCQPDLFVLDADGTDATGLIVTPEPEDHPSWSPDGTKIVFDVIRDGIRDIHTVNADGTGETNVTALNPRSAKEPDWSPDGSKIVYSATGDTGTATVFTMNPDGSGEAGIQETTFGGPVEGEQPIWSPDQTKIAYVPIGTFAIDIVPAAGGPRTRVVGSGWNADWQPLSSVPTPPDTGSGYPRPKSAGPVRVSLVVGYRECTQPTMEHGPPLAYPSCPPREANNFLHVGTLEADGRPTQAIGSMRFKPIAGDPGTPTDEADARIVVSQTDVLQGPNRDDFGGQLAGFVSLRMTDRFSAGGPDASATVLDFTLRFTVPCTMTPDPDIGGNCGLQTSVDALTPGLVREGRRSVWELGQVELRFQASAYDPGLTSRFLRQGVFVP